MLKPRTTTGFVAALAVAIGGAILLVGVVFPLLAFRETVGWGGFLGLGAGLALACLAGLVWVGVLVHQRVGRWWATGLSVVGAGAALVMLGVPMLVLVTDVTGQRALDRQWQVWMDWGGPTDYEQLRPAPMEDAEANAATWYLRAVERLGGEEMEPLSEPLEAGAGELAEALGDLGEVREALARAAALERVRWPVPEHDPIQPWDLETPSGARSLGRLLVAEAVVAMERDDPAAADEALRQAQVLAERLATEPMMVHLLVAAAVQSLALHAAEELYADCEEVPADFLGEVGRWEPRERLRAVLLAEAVWAQEMVREVTDRPMAGFMGAGAFDHDLAVGLKWRRRAVEELEGPRHEQDREATGVVGEMPWYALLTGISLSAQRAPSEVVAIVESHARLAQVAGALRRHKQAHGEYPASLETLDVGVTDPWDGEPIEYEREGEGFVLRSRAEDRRDDQRETLEWHWER